MKNLIQITQIVLLGSFAWILNFQVLSAKAEMKVETMTKLAQVQIQQSPVKSSKEFLTYSQRVDSLYQWIDKQNRQDLEILKSQQIFIADQKD
ncbi:MAG: hypothetical protein VX642_12195 [Bdellovibrionota bacterium]|nr:hypothetical protein [Bdellovibrionota bacterium]